MKKYFLYRYLIFAISLFIYGCEQQEEIEMEVYETALASFRDIYISVEASGVIEPEITVEVKSKASGEILVLDAETGDYVEEGMLLVQIDKRTPGNNVDQTNADLQASIARKEIALTQIKRIKNLLEKEIVTEAEYETAELELANAEALVISRQVDLENARIALDDTDVKAPISGIIIEKNVERGQVISSPTQDVGGGTILLKMADLSSVLVKTLVDETDIGKIKPGLPVLVNVAAFPFQPFEGHVLKIEPQATIEQNVTMFPVIIRLSNTEGILKPGMNAEVNINITHAKNILTIPTIALRGERDISTTASVLGVSVPELRKRIYGDNSSIFKDDKSSLPQNKINTRATFRNDYWVLIVQAKNTFDATQNEQLIPRLVQTGITDLEYSEIIGGLKENWSVLILPSSGLIERQTRIQNRLNSRMRLPGMGN